MHSTSPPYDPEQVIRDYEALCPLPTLSQPPAPIPISMTLVDSDTSIPIIVDSPTPQPLVVPVKEDW